MHQKLLELLIDFDWDKANSEKNDHKHGVFYKEAEEVFTNDDLIIVPDTRHSQHEERHYVYGLTNENRRLLIAFTVRNHKVRVITARNMSKKERAWYDKEIKKDS